MRRSVENLAPIELEDDVDDTRHHDSEVEDVPVRSQVVVLADKEALRYNLYHRLGGEDQEEHDLERLGHRRGEDRVHAGVELRLRYSEADVDAVEDDAREDDSLEGGVGAKALARASGGRSGGNTIKAFGLS